MDALLQRLFAHVSPARLRDLTFDLVRIPSPTGDSQAVTAFYAEQARAAGLRVQVVEDFAQSPSSIARYGDQVPGHTLTLDGHLDTIHAAHAAPEIQGDRIYGRGSGDMKSGVAAMLEAARVLGEGGVRLNGNLLLATHSLHEAPVGRMEGLKALIARGDVFVDAAIVAESGYDTLPICGKGQAIYEMDIHRAGDVLHENVARPQGISNPLDYAVALAGRMLADDRAMASARHPLLGPETYFLGQVHGGDFFNRVPNHAYLNGIHRYWPDKEWSDIYARFDALLASVPKSEDIRVDMRIGGNGLGYDLDPQAGIVRALRQGYQTVVGRELPLVGGLSVCDVNVIVREAGIAAVAHGTGSTTAHADLEWVELEGIVRATRVFLATIVNYLGVR
ncbi:MAG: M20/M25/M40 family metallo-hydrolase [Chloroflexota bacterium]